VAEADRAFEHGPLFERLPALEQKEERQASKQ
jgi:hypothetical protein